MVRERGKRIDHYERGPDLVGRNAEGAKRITYADEAVYDVHPIWVDAPCEKPHCYVGDVLLEANPKDLG